MSRTRMRRGQAPELLPFRKNMVAWYQFNTGITTATGVSQWDDQSGNGNHLVQATGSLQPSHESDGAILFDGTDDYMQVASVTLNQPHTAYLLLKQVSWTVFDDICAVVDGTRLFYQNDSGNEITLFNGSVLGASSATDLTVGGYGVVYGVSNGASSVIGVNNRAPVTGDSGAGNGDTFILGDRSATTTAPSNIQVAEVIIYNVAHNAQQRTKIINYLQKVKNLL